MTIDTTPLWQALERMGAAAGSVRIESLFADAARFARYSRAMPGMLVDFSKTAIDDTARDALLSLCDAAGVPAGIAAMFAGAALNTSENRAVLHTACRAGRDAPDETRETLARMGVFAAGIRDGSIKGHSGRALRHIVHIAIGGSQMGTQLAAQALAPWGRRDMQVHFVSNVEGSDLARTLAAIDVEETLFIVASKSFTTPETMLNAAVARRHVLRHYNGDAAAVAAHFAAISTQEDKVRDFGISPDRMFAFRDWVGGRFSSWSAIGLALMVYIGPEAFNAWLAGAKSMDDHFRSAPMDANLPVWLALAGIWHRNFRKHAALAVIPYHSGMARLPAWLQQVDMESNGKSVTREGAPVTVATGPLVFGEPGTDAQHSFFQWLHQSPDIVPVEFIGVKEPTAGAPEQHRMLTAHLLAQSESLMTGRSNTAEPHKNFAGNKPSVTIVIDRLDPHHLGMLMALYEHKVFVQGLIWNINSFDQFGVELGKVMAADIERELADGKTGRHDGSTAGLIDYLSK